MCARVLQAPPPQVSDGAVSVCAMPVPWRVIYPFIWILLQSNNFCTECIFDLVYILFTDLIKAYGFLFLIYSTSLENYFRWQYQKLGNWKKLKFKRYLNLPCNYYLCNFLLYISLQFSELLEAVFHSFTKTGLFYINIVI